MARIFRFILAGIFILGGIGHFVSPEFYYPLFPEWVPMVDAIIYISGVFELGVGAMLFFPTYRRWGSLGIILLLIAFLPMHIRDFFIEEPALKEMWIVIIRVPIQAVMIWMAWVVYRDSKKTLPGFSERV